MKLIFSESKRSSGKILDLLKLVNVFFNESFKVTLSYCDFYSMYDYYFARDFCIDHWGVQIANHKDLYSFSSVINLIMEMDS